MNPVLQQYLPQELREIAADFKIPEAFLVNNSNLIKLILKSKSLAEYEEKQNWFNLLPIMSPEQIFNPALYSQAQAKIHAQENEAREQEMIEADNLLTQM